MKVKYYPYQPHCFAFGGFDMQMINTLAAVQSAGVAATKLDAWSRDSNFDIIHLWGIGQPNYGVIDWAKKSGKLIVATVLLPYHDTTRTKLGYYYRFFGTRQLIHYYSKVDKIVVLNELQLKVLASYYKVPVAKIAIIPNIVEKQYFSKPVLDFSKKYGVSDYVLCTGNISRRKNQYNLAIACVKLQLNLVLVGNILDGEADYGKLLETLAAKNKNIIWIRELAKGSDELVSAYYNCSVYALPSHTETQPISALEAVAMKKPLILLDRAYARQSYYGDAILCKSPLVEDIEMGLKKWINLKKQPLQNPDIFSCTTEKVGASYKDCYDKLFHPIYNNCSS